MNKQIQKHEKQQDVFGEMPRTLELALRLAEVIANSSVVPKDYKGKAGDVVVAMQYGAELGLKPMQALQNIAVINGRPTIWGDAALALVLAHADCLDIIEELSGSGENMAATCTVKRRGQQDSIQTFSVADAKKAHLWGKVGPWSSYPKRMLQLRARGFALRDGFPDVLKGLITAEEVRDYKDITNEAEIVREVKVRKPIKEVSKEKIAEGEIIEEAEQPVPAEVDLPENITDIINKISLSGSPEEMYSVYEKGAEKEAQDSQQLKYIYDAAKKKAREFIANKTADSTEILQYVATIKENSKKRFINSKADAIKESILESE